MPVETPDAHQHDADGLLRLINEVMQELQPGTARRAHLDSALDRDLGLDSLSRVELLARIEHRFALRLPTEVLGTAETPRDLLRAMVACARTPTPTPTPASLPRPEDASPPARASDAQAAATLTAGTTLPDAAASLIEVLDWHVARHPERAHIHFYADEARLDTLSYGALHEAATRIAGALAASGVRRGDCVALMLPSGLDFFRCFFGILFAGAVPVPMYPPARPAQIEEHLRRQAGILRNCEARVLIAFDAVRPLARMLGGLAPTLARVTTPAELAATSAPPARSPSPRGSTLGLIQYTSGSTGDPKGVALSHANLLANIRAWGHAAAIRADDVCVSWLPLYHDMGLIGTWLGSLYHGCTLVLMSPLDFLARPERWLWAIHHHRGTITAAPNFAFELCVKRLAGTDLDGLDLSCWRLAANGAEPINPDTLTRFAAAFAPYGLRAGSLMPVYGLAEAAVGLCVPPPGRGAVIDRVRRTGLRLGERAEPAPEDDVADADALRFVCCGPPLPGHELRIVDAEGHPLPERTVGELEFRGPSATAGYYRNPTASAALIRPGGWLATGDHAYLAGGELHITGRAKEMIIRAGRNIYPYDLEQAIGELPDVRKGCVAVFGVRDAEHGEERLIVVAETRTREPVARAALEARIVAASMDQLGLAPDDVVLAPAHAVLKTSSGKIRRASIRDAYLCATLGAPTRAPWLQVLRLQAASVRGRARSAALEVPRWLHAGWAWATFAVLAPLAALAILGLPRLTQRWLVCHRLARLHAGLCGCPLRVAGLQHLPDSPCVLVANHASYIDGLVLAAALPRPVRFVAKAELRDSRVLRPLFERMGATFVRRFDAGLGSEDADALAAQAVGEAPLLFFAEGTFGREPGLRPFRLGAFRAAAHQGLAVVPVALAGTRVVLPDGSWRPRRGALTVTISSPHRPQGGDWHDLLALRDAVRADVLAHCGEDDATQS